MGLMDKGDYIRMHIRGLLLLASLGLGSSLAVAQPTLIELTQTGCQFLEVEQQDYGFKTQQASDCEAINAKTQVTRSAHIKVLELAPGDYIFRVHNKNVPYALGFWLRGKGLARLTLPSVSGGDIQQGDMKDYPIKLKTGEYQFSCPLNPTPDYRLVVH